MSRSSNSRFILATFLLSVTVLFAQDSPVNPTLIYGNAVHPPGASSWGIRLQVVLLYPQKTKP
jgi:hypothetical protein